MDDDDKYERFDVDNDFEGGQWINGEFYYTQKKEKKRQTHEDRIYGIFAEDSDSDGDKRSKKREKKDYSKPVSFISTGEVVQDEKKDEKVYSVEPKQDIFSGPSGLGFTKSDAQEANEEDEEEVLPTAFGKRIKEAAAERRKQEKKEHREEKQRAENRKDSDFGSFEKYTKGIGMKLMEKMGYKPGQGLGSSKQGIAKPVEAKLRPKNMGMGFGSTAAEEPVRARVEAGPKPANKAEVVEADQKLWKRTKAEQRQKRQYKTVSEVLDEAASRPGTATVMQPIIDMRGPQARVITNMEHLNMVDEMPSGDKTPMPELQHNLQLLVDLTQAEIQRLDAKLQQERDTATLLAREKDRLQDEAKRKTEDAQRLALVMNEVARCQARDQGLGLRDVEDVYLRLKKQYREEYILFNLASIALSQALPRLKATMHGWQPLRDPQKGVSDFARWRILLENESLRDAIFLESEMQASSSTDPYAMLVAEVILPPLRSAVLNTWEPRDPEPVLGFLELWQKLLPHGALTHLLDMLVLNKIKAAVESWEPRQETVPIHAWLHPWLPLMRTQLETVYPSIRYKLVNALTAWHPSDGSALILLSPWQRVFEQADWEAMLLRSIVPKLSAALALLEINPLAQNLEPFNWIMAWQDALPLQTMVTVLEQGFFNKWLSVLHRWLSHNPNFDEVTRWYLGWKGLFPNNILDHERVRAKFTYALNMMNSCVEGTPLPALEPSMLGVAAEPAMSIPSVHRVAGAAAELTFKDLVERFAAENGVSFLPKPGRFHEGLQVYSFGVVSVVLDQVQGVIRGQLRDRWAPVALETLLREHLLRSGQAH